MDSNSLILMTGDGMLRFTFRPPLTEVQSEQLLLAVQCKELRTGQQFRQTVAALVSEWQATFEAESVEHLEYDFNAPRAVIVFI